MKFPKNEKEHFRNVGRLRCVITDRPAPSIHHAQGGSVGRRLSEMGLDSTKGLGRRGYGEALILPLAPELHYVGPDAIDGGIGRESWEAKWGKQADFLDAVGVQVGYDLWQLHRLWSAR